MFQGDNNHDSDTHFYMTEAFFVLNEWRQQPSNSNNSIICSLSTQQSIFMIYHDLKLSCHTLTKSSNIIKNKFTTLYLLLYICLIHLKMTLESSSLSSYVLLPIIISMFSFLEYINHLLLLPFEDINIAFVVKLIFKYLMTLNHVS